jgi:hypothetical protein
MRRVVLALGAAAAVLLATPAAADTIGSVVTDDSGAEARASDRATRDGSSGAVRRRCEYRWMALPEDTPVHRADGTRIITDGTGGWYEKYCDGAFMGVVYISAANPADLVAEARNRIDLPVPEPRLNPPGPQLVNLQTWLWLDPQDWGRRQATAAVPGVSVTVTASPQAATWRMGDGTVVRCAHPGTRYDPALPAGSQSPTCSHTYRRSSAGRPGDVFTAEVTVRWALSWTVSGASGGGDLGVIDRRTTFLVPVAEIQALNVAGTGP